LRFLSQNPLSRWVEEQMGSVIGQVARMDFQVKREEGADIDPKEAESLIIPKVDLLEINNDHYRHKTFQRRIVTLPGISGTEEAIALEEDMSVINLEPRESEKVVQVAAIKSPDRFQALDKVLQETRFFELLDEAWRNSQKRKDEFSIVIKPNFSFMYSLTDISTFTDPRLVEHLVNRIYDREYRKILVVEAQSTYSVFYTNRDVPALAKYLGFRGISGANKDGDHRYEIVDLSEESAREGEMEVHPAWRDADFRISFAKNKSHAYSYYSLTIKNIYGALPRKNKFKEYHCNRKEFGDYPIYTPTIDFLDRYPVHFGLVDAYFSADGAFGVFADREPNYTGTIMGGDNLVAVDWVAASKMGLDPMISKYMELAVKKFGKPRILLTGDHSLYPNWRNVTPIVTKFANLLDQDYVIGGQFYAMFSTQDPFFEFRINDPELDVPGLNLLRSLSAPLRKLFFEWVRGTKAEFTFRDLSQWLKDVRKGLAGEGQIEALETLLGTLKEKAREDPSILR